jgi:hypothetical protein
VYSYQTPIGWRTGNGHWVIPNAHYSATTTGHQTLLRTAVGTYRDHTTKNAPLNPAHLAAASESTTRVPQR